MLAGVGCALSQIEICVCVVCAAIGCALSHREGYGCLCVCRYKL